jgi:hypothetical protein
MATIAPTFVKGCNGTLTCIGLDDTYSFQVKVGAFRFRKVRPLEDTSGYGDGCNSTFHDTINYHNFSCDGWLITNGNPGFGNMGGSGCTIVLTADTGRTITGTLKIEVFDVDHRYSRNVPVHITGRFSGAVTYAAAPWA